jgi:hypothetical protein
VVYYTTDPVVASWHLTMFVVFVAVFIIVIVVVVLQMNQGLENLFGSIDQFGSARLGICRQQCLPDSSATSVQGPDISR